MRIGAWFSGAMRIQGVYFPSNKGYEQDSNFFSGRANAACILACYMVLIQSWPPHLALTPIAQMDPPCMPFRDAGYSQADYVLNIQDVVYGVWKAKEEGLCGLKEFSLEEYVIYIHFLATKLIQFQIREVRARRYGGFQLAHTQLPRLCLSTTSTYTYHSPFFSHVLYLTHNYCRCTTINSPNPI